jgi:hypothetical protein
MRTSPTEACKTLMPRVGTTESFIVPLSIINDADALLPSTKSGAIQRTVPPMKLFLLHA